MEGILPGRTMKARQKCIGSRGEEELVNHPKNPMPFQARELMKPKRHGEKPQLSYPHFLRNLQFHGGGGGSRTRVRKLSARSIYVHSRCFDSRSLRLSTARFRKSQLMCFRLPPTSFSGKLSCRVDAPFQPYRRKLEGTATVN